MRQPAFVHHVRIDGEFAFRKRRQSRFKRPIKIKNRMQMGKRVHVRFTDEKKMHQFSVIRYQRSVIPPVAALIIQAQE